MTYELAKELKEAGFPWGEKCCDAHELGWHPTLSELIEACGTSVRLDYFPHGKSYANCCDNTKHQQEGTTPEEAVARLWLALNKHE